MGFIMNEFDRKHPLLSGCIHGAAIVLVTNAISPLTPIGTAFAAVGAMLLTTCLTDFGDRPECHSKPTRAPKQTPT